MFFDTLCPSLNVTQATDSTREVNTRRRQSLGVMIDSQLPHLVAFSEDLLSTGVHLYHIKVGHQGWCTSISYQGRTSGLVYIYIISR